jgi:DNA invertase Pin-like site-specific DNA recombinase
MTARRILWKGAIFLSKRYNAGLYLRLSVEDAFNSSKRGKVNTLQNDSTSIENQRALLTEYADLQGWNVAQVYSDDGYSGGSFDNRPAFRRMVRDAEAGLIDLILVKDLSRFGRDYIETGRYTEEVFPALGVRFIALMDNIDSEGNADLLPFRSILNDYHLKDLSRKVKSVMKAKAEKGEYIGSWAPYGFIKDPANRNRLLIDDYAAGVVRGIFGMRSQGFGFAKIAASLNNDGILSPRSYRDKQAGKECPGKTWASCVVSDILANEAYIGHAVRFKTGYLSYKARQVVNKPKDEWIRCENVFPAVVSAEVWDAVRSLDNKKSRSSSTAANLSLFSKLLRCADCGGTLVHKKSSYTSRVTGEKRIGHAYICAKHHNSGGSVCTRHTIREDILLAIIREDVRSRLETMDIDEGRIAREVQRRFNGESLDEAKKRRDELAARVQELASFGRKLYEDRLRGIIAVDTFKALSEKAEEDRADVKVEHEQLSELISAEERRVLKLGGIVPKLREFLSLESLSNDTLAAIIERIIVNESVGRSPHRTHDVRIVYRFEAEDMHANSEWRISS